MIKAIIEDQLKSIMLAETNQNYIFNPVGSIMTPEKKISPNRALIAISWTAFGVLMSTLLLLFRSYYNKGWFYLMARTIEMLGAADLRADISVWQLKYLDLCIYRRVL